MLLLDLSLTERVIIMSTYEELQIILTTALLIVAILTYAHTIESRLRDSTPAASRLRHISFCRSAILAEHFLSCNSHERK